MLISQEQKMPPFLGKPVKATVPLPPGLTGTRHPCTFGGFVTPCAPPMGPAVSW